MVIDKKNLEKIILMILIPIILTIPMWSGSYWTRIATGAAMWSGLAISWNILCGYAGYISFGHVAFFGIGAYATGILMQPAFGWNFMLTIPIGMALAALLAVSIGWKVLKLNGAYFAIATWAIGEALRELATVLDITGGSSGLVLPGYDSPAFFYYCMVFIASVGALASWWILRGSRIGYEIRATRDSEDAAQMQGINTTLAKNIAFIISSIIPAAIGSVYAYWTTFINPISVLNMIITDQMVIMVLFGGLGTLYGPILGAVALYILSEYITSYLGSNTWYLVALGIVVMLIVLLLPNGLVSLRRIGQRKSLLYDTIKKSSPIKKIDS